MKNHLFFFLLLVGFSTQAQIQFNSFQDLIDYADEHAISIQRAEIGEQIAQTGKKEAFANLLPTVNASLGANDNITLQPSLVPAQLLNPEAPAGTYEELTFGTKYVYSGGIQVQWDILNFQKLIALQTADIEIDKSRANTQLSKYNTYNSLAGTYYSIVLSQQSIPIYEENLEVAESIFKHAKEKYQNGLISEAELNKAKIKRLQNKRTLDHATNNLDQFYVQLQSQLNTDKTIVVKDAPQQFELKETTIYSIHPDVLWQRAQLEQSQSLLKQTKASRLPTISLIYQNNRNWATDDFMGFSDAVTLPQQTFGINISFTGLLSFSTGQKIKQSESELHIQKIQLQNTVLVKEKEDQLLQLQLQQSTNQLNENKEILALQKQNDQHAENKYQSGLLSLDERLNQYDDLLVTQDSYLQSLAAHTLAKYKIFVRQIKL